MPELPEVETVRRGLTRLIVGRPILGVTVLHRKSCQIEDAELAEYVLGAHVTGVRRYAKVLVIDLSTGYSLVAHLKMTGQMVFRDDTGTDQDWGAGHPTASFVAALPDRSTRVVFDLGGRAAGEGTAESAQATSHLFFNDQRIFGWIKLVPTPDVEAMPFLSGLGPEPLTAQGEPLTPAQSRAAEQRFLTQVRRHAGSPVKAAILDQAVIAGVGNIYADEALWSTRVHPATRVRDLTDRQLRAVFRESGRAMLRSLEVGGSTMRNYFQADGTPGSYLELFANVFRREGQPCPRCGQEIEKIRVAGRGTHVCPRCQPPPGVV